MRIANNPPVSAHRAIYASGAFVLALAAFSLAGSMAAYAADAGVPVPSSPTLPVMASNAPPPLLMPQPATVAPGNTVIPLMPGTANAPAAGNDAGKNDIGKNDIGKTATANEQKATDNAKSVIKRLENGGDQITLEDLNAARQTVARIEAMIDVEKHLSELEKIRSERTGESSASSAALAGAIPASALDPLPMPAQNTMPVFVPRGNRVETPPHPVEKPKGGWEKTEISRISGTEGKYSAVLKMADGTLKPAKVGDQIGDHMTVRWITSSTVLVEENGETHTLRVKGVDAIYSAMR